MNRFQGAELTSSTANARAVGGTDFAGGKLVPPVHLRPCGKHLRSGVAPGVVGVLRVLVETLYGRFAQPRDHGGGGHGNGLACRAVAPHGNGRHGAEKGSLRPTFGRDEGPEYEEQVEHDTVMVLGPDGKLIDRTEGDYDPEIRK